MKESAVAGSFLCPILIPTTVLLPGNIKFNGSGYGLGSIVNNTKYRQGEGDSNTLATLLLC